MQFGGLIGYLALLCLLGFQVSANPTEMQSDDWRASTILESVLNQYIKPHTGSLMDKLTNSYAWKLFGSTINGVQGVTNLSIEYLSPYYNEYVKNPISNIKEWVQKNAESQ